MFVELLTNRAAKEKQAFNIFQIERIRRNATKPKDTLILSVSGAWTEVEEEYQVVVDIVKEMAKRYKPQ